MEIVERRKRYSQSREFVDRSERRRDIVKPIKISLDITNATKQGDPFRLPFIQFYRSNLGNMRSEGSMDTRTRNTNKNTNIDGSPLGILGTAISTKSITFLQSYLHHFSLLHLQYCMFSRYYIILR